MLRRVGYALLVALLALVGVAVATPAGAVASVTVQRVFGANRYATAQAIATDAAMGTPTGAIVATGQNYPDALAASTLAGAAGPAPIILTESNAYTAQAKAALASLKTKGVSNVTVVGGTLAVSETVKNAITADGFTTTRVSGADRYATAAEIAKAANTKQVGGGGSISGLKTAIFATGENFPDALAGGPMAQRNDFPILLVTASTVPQATKDAITALNIKNAIILGGTTAVSSAVQTELATLTGDSAINRLSGLNRNATAAAVGDFEAGTLSFPLSTVVLATGINFPDALAAGVLAGVVGGAIVLTASLPGESQAFLDRYSSVITKIVAAGGTSAVSDADLSAAQAAAQTISNDTNLTAAPELQRVEAAGTDSGTGGPILRYVFDETLSASGIVAASFKAWTAYGEAATGSAAALDSSNSSAVLVAFPGASTIQINEATVYTVAGGGVQDVGGTPTPENELNASVGRTLSATDTRGPDLVSATFVSGEIYDLVFDSAITGVSTGSFRIVDSDGNSRSSSDAAVQTNTSVVRVTFAGVPASGSGNRVVALAGAVTAATTLGGIANNNQQAKVIAGRTAGTGTPDLVSVSYNTTNGHEATFVFDESVETMTGAGAQGTAAGFHLIYRNGSIATATSAERSSATGVTVSFPSGGANTVNELVAGAYIDQAAVATLGSTTVLKPNRPDQVGVTRSFEPGAFLGPKLTSATKATVTSGSTTTGYKITIVLDQAVSATLTQGGATGFFVVATDGVRTAITGSYCTRSTADTTNVTVVCDSSTATDTTSTVALAIANARVVTMGAGTVAATKVRTVGGSTWTASVGNHEETSVV